MMIRLLLAPALVLAIAPGCKTQDATPLEVTETGAGLNVSGPEVVVLEEARDLIQDAYALRNGRYVCQTRTFDGGTWISIDVAEEGRGQILKLYIREPASAWGDTVTCYEGMQSPVGRCTTYALWDRAITLVEMEYPWDRAQLYTNVNWDQMYLEWGDGWRCFVALANPSKPDSPCNRPPYGGPKQPGNKPLNPTNETGRGEQ